MTKLNTNYIYITLYFITNIFILLNYDGLYWDDWVAYDQDPQTMALFLGMIQHGIKGEFYLVLSKFFNHIYLFRVFVFIAYLLIGYFIYRIVFSTKIVSQEISKLIGFLAVVIPIVPVKIYISITPFIFPMLIFYFAFYLLAKNYPLRNKSLKVIILFLFLYSFSTNSILVFYASVLLYLYYMDHDKTLRISFENIKQFAEKRWDFIVLPVIYFIYKILFLVPFGLYSNYNKINFSASNKIFLHEKFIQFVDSYYIYIVLSCVLAVSLLIVLFIYIKRSRTNKYVTLFFLSLLLMFFAIFPYLAVGKMPVLSGPNSRFALLLGPALSMFFVSVIALLSQLFFKYKNNVFLFFISLLILLFISKNISQQYELLVDNFYKTAIMENFKENQKIKNGNTFVVYPYKGRSFYEWNGILKKTFGDTKRLMIPASMIKRLDLKGKTAKGKPVFFMHELSHYKQYNFHQWNGDQNIISVYVKITEKPTIRTQVRLLYYYIFNQYKYRSLAKSLISVEIRK